MKNNRHVINSAITIGLATIPYQNFEELPSGWIMPDGQVVTERAAEDLPRGWVLPGGRVVSDKAAAIQAARRLNRLMSRTT